MKAIGLIVEYNPFHNGHLYHLKKSKEEAHADVVVCVMSGYFLQRGEPASLPRRTRTMMAMSEGADIVIELPYAYSSQHASWFARGGVSILNDLLVDSFYFGSEYGDIDAFLQLDTFMQQHELQIDAHLKSALKQGLSYPSAQAYAFKQLKPDATYPDLAKPNNILGYHYVKAARELSATINANTILRTGSSYHSNRLTRSATIASATAIRKSLFDTETDGDVTAYVPHSTAKLIDQVESLVSWDDYYPLLQHLLLTEERDTLSTYYEAEEGLHNRLVQAAKQSDSFQSFMMKVKTKRYTWTRIQRLLVHIVTKTTKTEMNNALSTNGTPQSARLLGFTQRGQDYLRAIKKKTKLHLYERPPREKSAQQRLDEKAAFAYFSHLNCEKRILRYEEEYHPPVQQSDLFS